MSRSHRHHRGHDNVADVPSSCAVRAQLASPLVHHALLGVLGFVPGVDFGGVLIDDDDENDVDPLTVGLPQRRHRQLAVLREDMRARPHVFARPSSDLLRLSADGDLRPPPNEPVSMLQATVASLFLVLRLQYARAVPTDVLRQAALVPAHACPRKVLDHFDDATIDLSLQIVVWVEYCKPPLTSGSEADVAVDNASSCDGGRRRRRGAIATGPTTGVSAFVADRAVPISSTAFQAMLQETQKSVPKAAAQSSNSRNAAAATAAALVAGPPTMPPRLLPTLHAFLRAHGVDITSKRGGGSPAAARRSSTPKKRPWRRRSSASPSKQRRDPLLHEIYPPPSWRQRAAASGEGVGVGAADEGSSSSYDTDDGEVNHHEQQHHQHAPSWRDEHPDGLPPELVSQRRRRRRAAALQLQQRRRQQLNDDDGDALVLSLDERRPREGRQPPPEPLPRKPWQLRTPSTAEQLRQQQLIRGSRRKSPTALRDSQTLVSDPDTRDDAKHDRSPPARRGGNGQRSPSPNRPSGSSKHLPRREENGENLDHPSSDSPPPRQGRTSWSPPPRNAGGDPGDGDDQQGDRPKMQPDDVFGALERCVVQFRAGAHAVVATQQLRQQSSSGQAETQSRANNEGAATDALRAAAYRLAALVDEARRHVDDLHAHLDAAEAAVRDGYELRAEVRRCLHGFEGAKARLAQLTTAAVNLHYQIYSVDRGSLCAAPDLAVLSETQEIDGPSGMEKLLTVSTRHASANVDPIDSAASAAALWQLHFE